MLPYNIGSRCPQNIKPVALRLLILSITTCGLGSGESARSQIAGDGTPTPNPTLVNNSPTTSCTGTCNITGGTPIGSTLFHSFEQFSLPSGTFAIFTNPDPAIENVISRVTGTTPSQIDGFIVAGGMYPDFNLFLINPNGIIFGADAELNLNGSFIATTASSIKFDNGTEFNLNDPPPSVLTVNVPIGLQFGANPGAIQVRGNGSPSLAVARGNTLALVGGDVEMQGKSAIAREGRLEIGGVGANSLVNLNLSPTGFALDYSNVSDYRDVRLSQNATGTANAGQIQVRGRQVSLTGGAVLTANPTNLPGGDIEVYGAESVDISGAGLANSGLYAQNQGEGGDAGNITVTTPQLSIRDGGVILNSTEGIGAAGDITINASHVVLGGASPVPTPTGLRSESTGAMTGNSGKITINTEWLTISGGAILSTSTRGSGQGGDITVNNARVVEVRGQSILSTETSDSGNAGNLRIDTERLDVTNAAQVRSRSSGSGLAGNIDILNADVVNLDRGGTLLAEATGSGNAGTIQLRRTGLLAMNNNAEVTVRSTATGMAGNIDVDARIVELDNNATLSAENNATGGGSITLRNLQLLNLDRGSEISASTVDGQGGTINVNAGWLNLDKGSQITASHEGFGNAGNLIAIANRIDLNNRSQLSSATNFGLGGNIDINSRTLNLDNSTISAATQNGTGGTISVRATDAIALNHNSRLLASATGRGTAGNLNINTAGKLSIENNSEVAVRNTGTGEAGHLTIRAADIFLSQRGRLAASTAAGNGGNIDLRVDNSIVLRFNSEISAEAGGAGNGGNIAISAGGYILGVLSENSDIVANAFQGNGGNITATALGIFNFRQFRQRRTPESDFIASSEVGIDGMVTINTQEQPQLEPLPDDFLNTRVAEACDPLSRITDVGFYILGRRGLPPAPPFESLSSDGIWEDLRNPNEPSPRSGRLGEPVVEAQGWIVNERGNVVLVAELPEPSGSRCALSLGL